MAPQLGRNGWPERDVEQAITALKKGAYLLKYGKRGKPKFCPFSLSNDESVLIWISGKEEKHLRLSNVSRIISGQRTPIFQRHPRPEKEYQSFSLISNDGSLDVICKDKEEAEVWFSGLKALISRSHIRTRGSDTTIDDITSEATSPRSYTQHSTPLHPISDSAEVLQKDCEDQFSLLTVPESPSNDSLDKAFLDVALAPQWFSGSGLTYGASLGGTVGFIGHRKAMREESLRVSLSSAVSSSNQGSVPDDGDSPGDVYMWGEGFWDDFKADYLVPQALKSAVVLDVQSVGCGGSYAALVTKQGEVFSWGVELGGRLGHGVASVTLQPKLIDSLKNTNVQLVACGEYHTCAVSVSGDLFTWGDGTHNYGLLGHGNKVSHWIPKRVRGPLDGVPVSNVSCGPWHTAVVTSSGQLFTFGDGTFGVLGHGDRLSVHQPREVVSLKGLRTVRASCGVWHTAAVVDALTENTGSSDTSGKLFTWGDGDKGRLGHGDRDSKLVPTCVSSLVDANICQVACGHSLTVALSNSGQMYTMGTSVNGKLGNPEASAMRPTRVLGKLSEAFVEEIACGAYHVAARTSQNEVYTWGRGANGQLGHGDTHDRNSPALVEALKDKQVKSISCGTNFTAAICNHKRISYFDQSICSDCSSPFNFKRKRHNCYHCGLIFCRACSDKKALNAAMAPNSKRPYHVCNSCYYNLSKTTESHASFGDSLGRKGSVPQGAVKPVQNGNKLDFPPHSVRSRFASMESFSLIDCTDFQRNKKVDLSAYHILLNSAANSQWGRFDISNTSNSMSGTSTKINSASVPGSRIVSRAASPVSRDPSPRYFVTPNPTKKNSASVPGSRVVSRAASPVSRDPSPRYFVTPNPIPDGSLPSITENGDDQTNASFSEEIMMLKERVKELNHKVHLHDIELQKKAHDLKEAISVAAEETLKNQAAKEVIKSLASQLKEMAEKLPLARSSNFSVFPLDISITPLDGTHNRSVGLNTLRTYQESESDFSNSDSLYDRTSSKGFHSSNRSMVNNPRPTTRHANDCKGNESSSGNEWSKEDDPGVYLTLTTVAGGHRQQLKRVRFSRKRFTDNQAEQWWAANHARVYEQYNIVAPGK